MKKLLPPLTFITLFGLLVIFLGLKSCGLFEPIEAAPAAGFSTATPAEISGEEIASRLPVVTTTLSAPTATLTQSPGSTVTSTVNLTTTPTATPACVPDATFVQDVTLPDGSQVSPGSSLGKIWRIRNSGQCAWETGYTINHAGGTRFASPNSMPIPAAQPDQTIDLGLTLVAPFEPGDYSGNWRLFDPNGNAFGSSLTVKIRVVDQAAISADCPTDLADWAEPIAERLNRFAGDLAQLRYWLEGCGVINNALGGIFPYALQQPASADVIVIVQSGISGNSATAGSLLIYHLNNGQYTLTFQDSAAGRIDLQRVEDLNLDGRPEIVWTGTLCGPQSCTSRLAVERWSGTQYESWLEPAPETASASYDFLDSTPAGSGQEIVIHSQGVAAADAGPQRPWTETYISSAGGPYQSLQRIYGATPCLYHQILAANDLFNQTNRDYRAISDAYLAAINEASLQPCWTLTDEVKRLRDFARFRLMLVNMAIDDQIQAQYYRNTITFTPLQGAADAFLNDFAINANLSQACQAAHDYAAANPDAWNFMANWGYANPTFEAQDLCPGFRETTPTAAVIIRVDTTTLQVGDDLQIDGEVIGVGLPHYSLMIDEVPLATITYQNELTETATDARFELTSAVADGQTVRFTLRAKQPTTVRLALTASGEIQIPATGAYGWGSGSSEGLTITVQ